MADQRPDDSIFEPFDTFEETYKTVSSHAIQAAVLIPKGLGPGSHPVIFNIHGGFLATAHSLFAPFTAKWLLDLAVEKSAIIVSPDYRLLPSANGVADILEDLEDFWQWSKSELPHVLETKAPDHVMDLSRLFVFGGSAGGYCAIQLALSHPEEIAAVGAAYPLLDTDDSLYVSGPAPGDLNVLRFKDEDIPSKADTIAWIEDTRKTVATKAGFERTAFCVSTCQHGLFVTELLDNRGLKRTDFSPLKRLEAGKLPRSVWIMHGDDDVTVPRGTHKFVDLAKEQLPETSLRFDVAAGEDHAFDILDSNWSHFSVQALEFTTKAWLKESSE